jgi:tetratricopeptide (TPR) repeat protein
MFKKLPIRRKRRASVLQASVFIAGAVLLCAGSAAWAQAQPSQKPKAEAPKAEAPKSESPKVETPQVRGTLDDLFRRLKEAKNPQEAKPLATQIERRFARSGSDTADLLAARANEVFAEGEPSVGIEIIDRVIVIRPNWAEAYHRRALMFFAMGDLTRAMADLNATLQREPRHFGALAGLGLVFQRLGDQKRAFAAYAKAYEINPALESVKTILDRMRPDVEGRDI